MTFMVGEERGETDNGTENPSTGALMWAKCSGGRMHEKYNDHPGEREQWAIGCPTFRRNQALRVGQQGAPQKPTRQFNAADQPCFPRMAKPRR